MAALTKPTIIFIIIIVSFFFVDLCSCLNVQAKASSVSATIPKPKAWPLQFHSILWMRYNGTLEMIDLWYDWPNGRNFNIIQRQLGKLLYDLEWNNGTSFFYTLDSKKECSSAQLEVGILRPNWLDGANYLGLRHVDGFLCNVWEKADFIVYYEDVLTQRPVHWVFYTGREAHVMTFEVGAVLEDAKWQAPVYCFEQETTMTSAASQERLLDGFFKALIDCVLPTGTAMLYVLKQASMLGINLANFKLLRALRDTNTVCDAKTNAQL